jgi:hypothetical protein
MVRWRAVLSATARGNFICITDPHPVCGYGRIEAAPEGAVKRSGLSLSPRRARGFYTAQKLAALIGFGERVPCHGGSEAALWTYGETILFDPALRLINPAQQIFDILQHSVLRADQPKHDGFARRDETERLEIAGARRIEFKKEMCDTSTAE